MKNSRGFLTFTAIIIAATLAWWGRGPGSEAGPPALAVTPGAAAEDGAMAAPPGTVPSGEALAAAAAAEGAGASEDSDEAIDPADIVAPVEAGPSVVRVGPSADAAPSSPEAAKRLASAMEALKGERPLHGLLALDDLVARFPDTLESRTAATRLATLHSSAAAEGERLIKAGEGAKGRARLSQAFFAAQDKTAREALAKRLDEINTAQIFKARRPGPGLSVVTVKSGDSLSRIARREGVSWRAIKAVNKLRSTTIRIGQKLRVPKGRIGIEISKRRFELVLTLDDIFLKRWTVGIGKEDRTPEHSFKILERIVKPTYYAADGVYPFGHEKNILGTRWLGFNRTEEYQGFGIHGTAFPESIGTACSMGCIRMRNEDVEALFDYIPQGCEVHIRR